MTDTLKIGKINYAAENVWLNRKQIAVLFDRDIKTIGKHINNARKEELANFSVVVNLQQLPQMAKYIKLSIITLMSFYP
jgi:hypothetical protein